MTRQDEKQRLRRRLQEYAIFLAAQNRWQESVEINQQILTLEEDSVTYNRLGKAYLEQGLYSEAFQSYQQSIQISPTNAIAKKNLSRLEILLTRGVERAKDDRKTREQIDLRMFITEAGKTVITSLVDVPRSAPVEALTASEPVELVAEDKHVRVVDIDGYMLGRIEPRLGQRLVELMNSGNRYVAAIVQCDTRKIQILIREVYQHTSQRGKIAFPTKFSDTAYGHAAGLRYDYDAEELLEEEIEVEDTDDSADVYTSTDEDEEIGLEDIEKDIPDDDENEE